MSAWALSSAYASDAFDGWRAVLPALGLLCCVAAVLGYYRTALGNRLLPSLGLLLAAAVGTASYAAGAEVPSTVLWISASVLAMERLPLAPGLGTGMAMVGLFVLIQESGALKSGITVGAVLLSGYVLRLDAQPQGIGFRLLAQERAAREAEATSAALAERARIAREIHDVLAHSLSAQLVHLEAARLQIERGPEGPFREQILERWWRHVAWPARASPRPGRRSPRCAARWPPSRTICGSRRSPTEGRARWRGAAAADRRVLHSHGEDPYQQPLRRDRHPRPRPRRCGMPIGRVWYSHQGRASPDGVKSGGRRVRDLPALSILGHAS